MHRIVVLKTEANKEAEQSARPHITQNDHSASVD